MQPGRRRTVVAIVATVVVAVLAVVVWRLSTTPDDDEARPDTSPSATSSPSPEPPAPSSSTTPTSGPVPSVPAEPAPDDVATPAPAVPAPPVTGGDVPAGTRTLTVAVAGYSAALDLATVTGYLDVVESGGTCAVRLTSGATTVSAEGPATTDATTTACAVDVPGSRLASGTWTATLTYASPSGSAAAAPVTIEVAR
jgi:hypothetical protein